VTVTAYPKVMARARRGPAAMMAALPTLGELVADPSRAEELSAAAPFPVAFLVLGNIYTLDSEGTHVQDDPKALRVDAGNRVRKDRSRNEHNSSVGAR
jgi:hypothetical protein